MKNIFPHHHLQYITWKIRYIHAWNQFYQKVWKVLERVSGSANTHTHCIYARKRTRTGKLSLNWKYWVFVSKNDDFLVSVTYSKWKETKKILLELVKNIHLHIASFLFFWISLLQQSYSSLCVNLAFWMYFFTLFGVYFTKLMKNWKNKKDATWSCLLWLR